MFSSECNHKKLLLIFSTGVSIEMWDKIGMLTREVHIYSTLSKYFSELWWLSYGRDDNQYHHYLANHGIRLCVVKELNCNGIVRKSRWIPEFVKHQLKFLRQFDFVKTNQLSAAHLGSEIKKQACARLILRQGYITPLKFQLRTLNPLSSFTSFLQSGKLYDTADAIIITSYQAKNYLKKWYKIDREKIHVIQNYIDTNLFRPLNSIEKRRDILFVGRFAFQKNIFNIIRALDNLSVSVTMVGTGKYREQIEKIVKKKGMNIEFYDRVNNNELPDVYNAHRIFLLPSRYEGNSKVLLEAMACGLPVIASNVWGNNEMIHHMENGYLCDTNASSIHQAVQALLTNDHLRATIAKNAREYVVKNNNLSLNIHREIAVYNKVLAK